MRFSAIPAGWRSNVTIKARVKSPATTPAATGGSSVPTATLLCEDQYSLIPRPAPTATWTRYTLDFADPVKFSQEKSALPPVFDESQLIAVQLQVDKALPFDFSVDDVAFF